jgi:hypothetical protein
MTIGTTDIKMLWGRAGGRCCNPGCRSELIRDEGADIRYHLGEMAHVIAQSSEGPRAQGCAGSDAYDNLILLCPTCHTMIDKLPDSYPENFLRKWKREREKEVSLAGCTVCFSSLGELKKSIGILLAENHYIFDSVGPKSTIAESDPESDAVTIWEARKLDTILPNNRRIINTINNNLSLLNLDDLRSYIQFKEHVLAYEQQQYGRTDFYPTFRSSFGKQFAI